MKAVAAVWEFIAGDSRRAPLGVAAAIAVALVLLRTGTLSAPAVGVVFAVIVMGGLAAGVFERR